MHNDACTELYQMFCGWPKHQVQRPSMRRQTLLQNQTWFDKTMQPFLLVHFDKSISFCLRCPLLLLGGICFEHASAHLRISAAAIK